MKLMDNQFIMVLMAFVYQVTELLITVRMYLEAIVESVITMIQLLVCTIMSKDITNIHT